MSWSTVMKSHPLAENELYLNDDFKWYYHST